MTINAYLDQIRPIYDPQHPYCEKRVQAIVDSLYAGDDEYGDPIYRDWDFPPVVCLENEGNGHTVLDGHHRFEAAKRLGLETIPAWVVEIADYCRLVDAEFYGDMPTRLMDLRDHIMCGDLTANDVASHGDDVMQV